MDKEQSFITRLQNANQKVSSPRLAIFRLLLRRSPLTTSQLVALSDKQGIDRATTYRTIQLFRQLEIISDLVAGGKRLVELSDHYESHHHHFWCRKCGKLIDFDSPEVEKCLENAVITLGGTISSHHVEISGLCKDCTIMLDSK